MTTEWTALAERLRRRREEGWALRLWWRDDDAVRWSEPLARLLSLSEAVSLPLALAVVPDALDASLVEGLDRRHSGVTVLQHGWRHRNEAIEGGRAVECGGVRETDAILADLGRGRRRLDATFGKLFRPVLVPPWNRIEDRIATRLPSLGYVGLSTSGRAGEARNDGFTVANAHLDVLRWRGGARFAGEAKLLAEIHADLDRQPAEGPATFCLLTHHLDHDAETWAFLKSLLPILMCWTDPVSAAEIFPVMAHHV